MTNFIGGLKKTDYAVIGLTIMTAVIHLFLGRPLFILNGLGYLALLAAMFLPMPRLLPLQSTARWGLVVYTAVTIVLYFLAHPGGLWMEDGLGIMTKMVEVILILLLLWSQSNE